MFLILLRCHLNFLHSKYYCLQQVLAFHCTSNQIHTEQLTIPQTVTKLSAFYRNMTVQYPIYKRPPIVPLIILHASTLNISRYILKTFPTYTYVFHVMPFTKLSPLKPTPTCTCPISHTVHLSRPSHSYRFDKPNKIR